MPAPPAVATFAPEEKQKAMKTFITSIALMILLTAPTAAQDITVTGKVTDTRREPVPFASVVLRSLPDSAVVAGSMTGDDGGFSLSAPEGSSYLLTVSFIGYLPHEQVCGTSSDLGDIVLEDDVQMLEEAVVVAHRVEHRPNGYHINLRNDPIAKGRQATEMLSFLPGVSTDDESVQILSRTTHAIYIDGIKIQNYSELKALQASQIESVDIDYMSGVEEAADAQGGVIRIKLKKQVDGGFSGYLQASAGANMYGYGGESARSIFRARTGNLSIYNTLAYVRQRYFSDNESEYLFKETGSDILSREEYRSWGIPTLSIPAPTAPRSSTPPPAQTSTRECSTTPGISMTRAASWPSPPTTSAPTTPWTSSSPLKEGLRKTTATPSRPRTWCVCALPSTIPQARA